MNLFVTATIRQKIAPTQFVTTLCHMHHKLLPLLLALPLCFSCGNAVSEQRCLNLTEAEGNSGLMTSLPSKLSFLFRVDTCAGEPVPGLNAKDFQLFENGRTLSEFESQRRIQEKGQRFELSSVVLLDMSGSILRTGEFAQLKSAAAKYIEAILPNGNAGHTVSLMTFDGRAHVTRVVDFTNSSQVLLNGLNSLGTNECRVSSDCAGFSDRRTCAGFRCVDDSTNLNGAIVETLDVIDARITEGNTNFRDAALVVFTDGTDQASRVTPATTLARAKASKTHIFTVGLGGEIDEISLRAVGRDGFFPVAKAAQLETAFEAVAQRVSGLANRYYLLEYCSPRRNGTHTLKVTATFSKPDGTNMVGGISREFDATGFASGCEL
jgi:uncharacterized protein YegL